MMSLVSSILALFMFSILEPMWEYNMKVFIIWEVFIVV